MNAKEIGTAAAATAHRAHVEPRASSKGTTMQRYEPSPPKSKPKVQVTRLDTGETWPVSGQVARTVKALLHSGKRGVTALEMSTWALRLAAYIETLRNRHGLSISCERETHTGGWHGRYRLHTPIKIEPVEIE